MATERDSQRSKVYKAENSVPSGKKFELAKDVQNYCNRVLKTKWWQENYPAVTTIEVTDGRGARRASGSRVTRSKIRIKMPKFARKEIIVIHEVVHGLATKGAWHGKEFCGEYLKVVGHYMGRASEKALRDAFDLNGVMYTEPPTFVRITPVASIKWEAVQKVESYQSEFKKKALIGAQHIGTVYSDPKMTNGEFVVQCLLPNVGRGTNHIVGRFSTEEQATITLENSIHEWLRSAGLKGI
jgi:putative metallohydrolase (TIGR04338 family)